ncbi:MAG TPA: GFA family protein [Myxococcota bacterium]|nr:GFA family protein [Myxococcota bacterium]
MYSGSCFCRAVRYQVEGAPFHETLCHCSICRRTSGAPFVAWASFPRAGFRFTRGLPARIRSSKGAWRSFCAACGTPLVFEHDDFPDELDITLGSLDEPESIQPKDHTHVRSKLSWVDHMEGLAQYSQGREEP